MALKFQISEEKALEALVYIATQWPNITPFYVAKILFLAEKEHLNRYARPIVADTFIAMPWGPVPSTLRDYIEGNYLFSDFADRIPGAIAVNKNGKYPEITALRAPNLELFSKSDLQCLDNAVGFCKGKPFKQLSDQTHLEKAWLEAPSNGPMDYEKFIDDGNKLKESIIEQLQENAAYGVL